jgi:hypothetical protein
MKKYFLVTLFFLASCTPQADLKPKQEINSDLFSKEMVVNIMSEKICSTIGKKTLTQDDFVTNMNAINKKYNIDDSAKKEKLKRSVAEHIKDKQFAIDVQSKIKALCGLEK